MNAQEALKKLKEGNKKFVEASEHNRELNKQISWQNMGAAQKPFAVILGCSDSRVPAELVFDQGLGDLFVIRVAGNIVAPSQIGSVEFACQQFGTQLVVVLGHTKCGAISATVDGLLDGPGSLSPNLASIVDRVTPAVHSLVTEQAESEDKDTLLHAAMQANVQHSVENLKMRSAILRGLIDQGRLQIVGAEYSIETGVVDFYTND